MSITYVRAARSLPFPKPTNEMLGSKFIPACAYYTDYTVFIILIVVFRLAIDCLT
jgi:hypothetical protein